MSEPDSIIGAQPFLRGMPAAYVHQLAGLTRHVRIPAGTRLFDEGGTADHFWLIDAGQVVLDALVPGRGRLIIETLGRGDVIGLSWLTASRQFRYGAVCRQSLQAFEFDAAAVRRACEDNPGLGYAVLQRFLAIAANRLQATRARLLEHCAAAA
jgi:CRP-like cAMP-binding protein